MKQTRSITLGLLASLTVVSCGDNDHTFFANKEACATVYTPEQCRVAEENAHKKYEETARTYVSKTVCEQENGECQKSSIEDMFSPAMEGFVVEEARDGTLQSRPVESGPPPDCRENPNVCGHPAGHVFVYVESQYYGTYSGSASKTTVTRVPEVSEDGVGRSMSEGVSGESSHGGFGEASAGHAGGGE